MENISTGISILIAISGVVLGWGLNQISHWYKNRKEENKIRKQVLFYLFEVRDAIPRLNINSHVNEYMQYLNTKIPGFIDSPEIRIEFEPLIKNILSNVVAQFQTEFQETENNYKYSVTSLASVEPLLAYRLSGNTLFVKLGGINDLLIAQFKENIDVTNIESITAFYKGTDKKMFIEIQEHFENCIIEVSRQINFVICRNSKKLITQLKEVEKIKSELVKDELDDYFISMGINFNDIAQKL